MLKNIKYFEILIKLHPPERAIFCTFTGYFLFFPTFIYSYF